MRIYLDSNAFQELKQPAYSELLSLIIEDKKRNIYCFSEAHLYDLARDKTDAKFEDMDLISKIAENHCWYFDDRTHFSYRTPREYYDSFIWDQPVALFDGNNIFGNLLKTLYSAIPISLSSFIDQSMHEVGMPEIPEPMKAMSTQSATMYDLMVCLFDLSTELSEKQKQFKQVLQYSHTEKIMNVVHRHFGINGFEDSKITDLDAFRDSYTKFILRDGKPKLRYDLFIDMYTGLELLGLVKGKPKKQALMNLTNDARHGYFGAFCDVVVTKDSDMIDKLKFLYRLWNVRIPILTIPEFKNYQLTEQPKNETVLDLLNAASNLESLELTHKEVTDEKLFTVYKLPDSYFGLFNIGSTVASETSTYFYLSRESANLSEASLYKEIQYITERFVDSLGPDDNKSAQFDTSEMDGEKWPGRQWTFPGFSIILTVQKKLTVFYFANSFTDDTPNSDEKTSEPSP